MATVNPRLNITVSNEIADLLSKTAKSKNTSMSKVALELIEWAIEERGTYKAWETFKILT